MSNKQKEEQESEEHEWTRYQIHIPEDDYDEDDELDDRLEKARKQLKGHVNRGQFFGI